MTRFWGVLLAFLAWVVLSSVTMGYYAPLGLLPLALLNGALSIPIGRYLDNARGRCG